MDELIQDYHSQHWLKSFIKTLPYNEQVQLRNLKLCNSKIVQPGHPVFLLSNGSKAKFHGQATCKNTFACPCCSARIASKYAKKIADALDLLKKDYYAVMVTFTVPHLKFMSCKETTDILYKVWQDAFNNKTAPIRKNKSGYMHAINEFWKETEIKYMVRAAEYTWGQNGWHPHFHCIFWFPRSKVDLFYSYQKAVSDRWWHCCKRQTLKYWKQFDLHSKFNLDDLAYYLFDTSKNFAVKFSTYECTSSNYLTGWTSDKELTGNIHKSATWEGHYTPYQILDRARHGDKEMAQLYREFMLNVTRKPVHHRFTFSTGLHKKITEYQNTKNYKEIIKKKETAAKWEVLWWFEKDEWNLLNDLNYNSPILSNILWLAVHKPKLLEDFLAFYGITMPKTRHIWIDTIEKIFNEVA